MKSLRIPLGILLYFGFSITYASPNFWKSKQTPTPPEPPPIQQLEEPVQFQTATPTPVPAPFLGVPSPTPTSVPGLSTKNPTKAALFSMVIPGSGQVYAGDALKGIAFAALFGVGFWQTFDNLQLVPDPSNAYGSKVKSKNEEAGELIGFATLAVYGFGIQDAFDTAAGFNKRNNLDLSFGIIPRPQATLAFMF